MKLRKKLTVFILGAVGIYFLSPEKCESLVKLASMFMVGQGIADHGKEKK
jgi:hypothetical protein